MAASFSVSVKDEILASLDNKGKYKACICGMILCCKIISDNELVFMTENETIAQFYIKQIENVIGEGAVRKTVVERKNSCLYLLEIDDKKKLSELFEYCGFGKNVGRITEDFLSKIKLKNIPSLIGGMFLSCGSVIDPNKEYHLEFVFPTLDLCNDFGLMLLERFEILAKHTSRKNSEVVYLKESESIEDMLTLMGATMGTLEIMNVKILKTVRNKVNRAMNCDSANIEKSMKASQKQIEDINLIIETMAFDELSSELQEMAQLRLDNPDMNLKELGETLGISRSGANHRLQRIAKIAQAIRDEKGL